MSVLIKMKMPESCPCELLGVGYDLYCSFVGGSPARLTEYNECCQNGTRPSWCPLVHVTAHGRLIDADALKQFTYEIYDPMGIIEAVPVEFIDNAPTVIEAEDLQ